MTRLIRFTLALLLLSMPFAPQPVQSASWQTKVNAWVLDQLNQPTSSPQQSAPVVEFIVFLAEQADLSSAANLTSRAEKGAYVFETLRDLAARTQPPLLKALDRLGAQYRPYWIANMIWVSGDIATVQAMAQRTEVAHIYANPQVRLDVPEPQTPTNDLDHAAAIQWNLLKVQADKVWQAGVKGAGVVIGGQDTGYDWDHPALIQQYRGWDGTQADHNYNWHDAIHQASGNPCGANASEPCDDHGHGTHTMGIMVGDDGAGMQIGMAPQARWIGCRNMNSGYGTPITYSECYQWFLAPTELDGDNPDPTKAPDIINNSWGCPLSEGCTDPTVLKTVVEAVQAAGILTVHSAGNDGPACSSINTPAAIYEASFTVANTTSEDSLASGSSRGPVLLDGSGQRKPDIAAPGSGIYSSYLGSSYTTLSGTSMAAPHVAGLAALLISARPSLAEQVATLRSLMEQTAVPVSVSPEQTCGGISSAQIPNNAFGWGRINAWEAYRTAVQLTLIKQVSSANIQVGESLTYTLTVSNLHPSQTAHQLVLSDTLPIGTQLITASLTFSQTGQTVVWRLPSLEPGQNWETWLQVRVRQAGQVSNQNYDLRSQERPDAIRGAPVFSQAFYVVYLPVLSRP